MENRGVPTNMESRGVAIDTDIRGVATDVESRGVTTEDTESRGGGVPADTGSRVLLLTWTVGCSYTRGVAADDRKLGRSH